MTASDKTDPFSDFRYDSLSGDEAANIDGDRPVSVISEVGKSGAYVASTHTCETIGMETLR